MLTLARLLSPGSLWGKLVASHQDAQRRSLWQENEASCQKLRGWAIIWLLVKLPDDSKAPVLGKTLNQNLQLSCFWIPDSQNLYVIQVYRYRLLNFGVICYTAINKCTLYVPTASLQAKNICKHFTSEWILTFSTHLKIVHYRVIMTIITPITKTFTRCFRGWPPC